MHKPFSVSLKIHHRHHLAHLVNSSTWDTERPAVRPPVHIHPPRRVAEGPIVRASTPVLYFNKRIFDKKLFVRGFISGKPILFIFRTHHVNLLFFTLDDIPGSTAAPYSDEGDGGNCSAGMMGLVVLPVREMHQVKRLKIKLPLNRAGDYDTQCSGKLLHRYSADVEHEGRVVDVLKETLFEMKSYFHFRKYNNDNKK